MADQLKAQGNAAFAKKDFETAIDFFTQAINVDPNNHVLYSNRSASYASLKKYDDALKDAEKCVSIKPDWVKGYSRKGAALHGLGDLQAASQAYQKGLDIDPDNTQLKNGLASVENSMRSSSSFDPFAQLSSKLNDPELLQKISANPETSALLADPEFMQKLAKIQQNPQSLLQELNDPRVVKLFGVLMGIDQMAKETGNSAPAAASNASSTPAKPATPEPTPASTGAQTEDVSMEESTEPEQDNEKREKAEKKAAADAEKLKGNEHYKKRDFPVAIEHYKKAWEMFKDITYLNNLAAAYYEADELDECLKTCQMAVDEGREARADFKLIAKALGRMGTAYQKQGDFTNAIEYFQRSLTEHRSPDILTKLKETEKAKEKADREAYVNPELAEQARAKGNELFKAGDFAGAIKEYTEVTKRAPNDPRGFSNRAAAYLKVMAPAEAIRDCNTAIGIDATFAKAYLRKAQGLFMLKEYTKCIDACNEASEVDRKEPNTGKNAREIEKQLAMVMNAMAAQRQNETEEETMARIQKDPELVSILQDPVMQTILSQARQNPSALMEHMKNPSVKSKVEKLIAAGVIRLG
ncbi:chaperone activator Sti1 [Schizosaccharomyces japonicus yFS275]|uniref:Chaperone activator Sti1 n=1 Tax=Schizosaccharomyces japonicus (strain yFS275 / FY16936) TaxID=402676 RepID=B6K2R9_SCHJY|nr:chaperone activator Sti1 [Schizosaccharomyces japonicus yFS275]EEB08559.1 chaperone activator Sti1 [Schizosaccharomyces japonicus yFS275]